MQSVSSRFLAALESPAQPVLYRIELMAVSGFNFPADVEATATASSVKHTYAGSGIADLFFAAGNVVDGQSREAIRYAVCDTDECETDSDFCCVGAEADNLLTPGWWSEVESDSTGVFATPPHIEITYSQPIAANRIRLTTTVAYCGLSRARVAVKYQGEQNYTNLGDWEFMEARTTVDLGMVKEVKAIMVQPLATARGNQPARMLEVEPLLEFSVDTLGSLESYVQSISVEKCSGELRAFEPARPGFGINRISLELSREAPLTPDEGQLIRVLMGFDPSEMLAQGVFLISEVNEGVNSWRITGHGLLSLTAHYQLPDWVFRGHKTSELATAILNWAGFDTGAIVFDLESDDVWDWYILEAGKCSEALNDMALTAGVAIYEDEHAGLHCRNNYGDSVMLIGDSWIADINRTKPQEINYVQVNYGSYLEAAEDEILRASGDLGASAVQSYVYSFSKSPVINVFSPVVNSFRDSDNNDLTLPSITAWYADAYSLNVTLANLTNVAGTFQMTVRGIPLDKSGNEAIYEAKDIASIRRRGVRPYNAPPLYTSSAEAAKAYGDRLLTYMRHASGAMTVAINRPLLHLQLRDVVTVDSGRLGIHGDYLVVAIELELDTTVLQLIPIEAVI